MLSQIGLLLVTGVLAGILGSILGIGGGIILTPFLTLIMGLDIKYAIAASIVCVIATSSGATIAYLKDDMLNLRVAMFLKSRRQSERLLGRCFQGWCRPVFYLSYLADFYFFQSAI